MKKTFFMILSAIFCGLVLTNCDSNVDFDTNNEHIKSIWSNGTIVQKYNYDFSGRIVEENSLYYFKKYIYDTNGRLEKVESAFNTYLLSSSYSPDWERKEFMTSKNSEVNSYSLYSYDGTGKLSVIKNYFKETGKDFEYRSMQSVEFDGDNIVKFNYHEPEGKITQYYIYTYDKYGNVTKEKYYINIFGPENTLESETSYQYDSYKNPYRILRMLGNPGLWSNANNIIEVNTTRYRDIPGIDKYSSSKNTYKYNKNGYPIKVIEDSSEFEYKY